MIRKLLTVVLFCSACFISVRAEVRFPKLISDGLVLQRNTELKLWGSADAGEQVNVTFKDKHYKAQADANGHWSVTIPAQDAGGPYSIKANDKEVKNVWVGDVFLCSGQSNMELPINRVTDLYKAEVDADRNEQIHYIKTPRAVDFHAPQADFKDDCHWLTLMPETAESFSAVCYFFAKAYYNQHKVPVGIINSSVGGSPVEAWISEEQIKNFPEQYNDMLLCQDNQFVEAAGRLDAVMNRDWMSTMNKSAAQNKSTDWRPISLFASDWAMDGLRAVNGLHLFKKTFRLTSKQASQDALLRMGCIVDADSVFVNGHFVGTTAYQYPPRKYPVSAKYLKEGDNEIEVRLISYGGTPCFVPDKPYKLIFKDSEVSLTDGWMYRLGIRMPAKQGSGVTFIYKPVGLYNGMIAPLLNLKFAGAIWYQGESNVGRFNEYAPLLKTLIADWRSALHEANMPFVIIEIASFLHPQSRDQIYQAGLRNAQKETAETTPRTALVPTMDLGEWNDIHPLNKKTVGERTAVKMSELINNK